MKRTRVAIVDDHELVREGLRTMINGIGDCEVAAIGGTGEEALRIARQVAPDVLLLDIELPDISGVDVAERLRAELSAVRIIGVSAFDFRRYVYGVLSRGAVGFLRKEEVTVGMLTTAITDVVNGNVPWISATLAQILVREQAQTFDRNRVLESLSPREYEVLHLVARGSTNEAIAAALFIGELTARNHVDNIRSKVDVRTRAELVAWAWTAGVVSGS
jgi:DNA-binding NarL/FixJ family response regulator